MSAAAEICTRQEPDTLFLISISGELAGTKSLLTPSFVNEEVQRVLSKMLS